MRLSPRPHGNVEPRSPALPRAAAATRRIPRRFGAIRAFSDSSLLASILRHNCSYQPNRHGGLHLQWSGGARAHESLNGADRRRADQDGVVIGVDVNHRGVAGLGDEPFGVSPRRPPGRRLEPWACWPGPTGPGTAAAATAHKRRASMRRRCPRPQQPSRS